MRRELHTRRATSSLVSLCACACALKFVFWLFFRTIMEMWSIAYYYRSSFVDAFVAVVLTCVVLVVWW